MSRLERTSLVIVIVLVMVITMPLFVIAQEEEVTRTGLRPDAPPYAVRGPYPVGTREFVIDPDAERPIAITVWYPALNPDGLEEAVTYTDIAYRYGELPEGITPVVYGHALQDAELDMSGAPYPLVIYSIGWGGFRQWATYLTEHLASHGFVVIATDHIEIPIDDDVWMLFVNRPQDIVRTIAYADTLTADGGAMPGMIDTENTGVVGWSYGGYTALGAGGARLDLQGLQARCADIPEDDPGHHFCTLLTDREEAMAELMGLDAVPDGLWPTMNDPRVKAIVPHSGDSWPFGENGLAAITVPTMAIVGSVDTGTPPDWGAYPTYENVSSEKKALIVLENGEHMIFSGTCPDTPWIVDLGLYFACSDAVWDMDRVHDLINHFTTAFLLDILYGDADAHAALLADNVAFPGVIYETTLE